MDSRRFDALVRSLGTGASRRSVLRGLLGLGGAAILADRTDARTIGTRPTLPPPPPPPPPTTTTLKPTTTTADPCPPPNIECGLECCSDDLHCCDRECCAPDAVCLTKAFYGEVPPVEEEVCCLLDQTCDGQCCSGDCFWPVIGETNGATVLESFERECCPAELGFTFCEGEGAFSAFGLCCTGETATCCHNSLGAPVCIADDQCCTTDECVEAGFDRECITCNIDTNACEPSQFRELCNGSECGVCAAGYCRPYDESCGACEICTEQLTCGPACSELQTCCSGRCFDGADQTCCIADTDCTGICEICQFGEGLHVGVCGFKCSGDTPKFCADLTSCACIPAESECCWSDEECSGICEVCQFEPGEQIGACGFKCSGDTPKFCADLTSCACIPAESECCWSDEECSGICEVCQFEPGEQIGACGFKCSGDTPKFCANLTSCACIPADAECCWSHGDCTSLDEPSHCIEGICDLDDNICVARNFCSNAEGSRPCCQGQDGDYYCETEDRCPDV